MRQRTGYDWVPLWIDKWIFGSTRHELLPDEQSVWVDFLALAGKDDGYIRANKDVPYPLSQLAGLLFKPEELLRRSVDKCVQTGKLTNENGILHITNWETYKLSERHKRRIKISPPGTPQDTKKEKEKDTYKASAKADAVSAKADISAPIPKPPREYPTPGRLIKDYNALDLIGYFGKEYQKRIGFAYPATFGKEGAIFKDLLRQYNPALLINTIQIFFEEAEKDGSWVADKLTIGVFKSKMSSWLQKRSEEIKGELKK